MLITVTAFEDGSPILRKLDQLVGGRLINTMFGGKGGDWTVMRMG
jgi:hypothetical protein